MYIIHIEDQKEDLRLEDIRDWNVYLVLVYVDSGQWKVMPTKRFKWKLIAIWTKITEKTEEGWAIWSTSTWDFYVYLLLVVVFSNHKTSWVKFVLIFEVSIVVGIF